MRPRASMAGPPTDWRCFILRGGIPDAEVRCSRASHILSNTLDDGSRSKYLVVICNTPLRSLSTPAGLHRVRYAKRRRLRQSGTWLSAVETSHMSS